MKKLRIITVICFLALSLFACGGKGSKAQVIKVGASITPHSEILTAAKDLLAEEGYTLEIIEYNDYILPNTATEDGEIDANFFQHEPYLQNFNKENDTHLISVAGIHYEPLGLYAGKIDSINNLKIGSIIAVPNDSTNEARALLLLEANGLIKLKEEVDFDATIMDIVENPLSLQIVEIAAPQLTRALSDVDIAVINGNYAIEGGLNVANALVTESSDSQSAITYTNVLVVKEGNENSEKTQALIKALKSPEVKQFIIEHYAGSVVPMF